MLEVEFLDRLSEPVREKRARSVSDIIRSALQQYDFSNLLIVRPSQLMISVRLPTEIRRSLKKIAREKHTSIGQLVRTAVEAYLPQLENEALASLDMPIPHVELPETETPAAAAAEPVAAATPERMRPRKKTRRKAKPDRRVAPRRKRETTDAKPRKAKTTAAGLKRSRPRRKS